MTTSIAASWITYARARYDAAATELEAVEPGDHPPLTEALADTADLLPAALDALTAVLAKCDVWAEGTPAQQSAAGQVRDAIHLAVFSG